MKILVAMECSGVIRSALRAVGHDAWSCDLQPAEDGSPHHIQANVYSHEIVHAGWQGLIAHPDCTFLTVSGARWQSIAWRQEMRESALHAVRALWAFPIRRKAIENPIGRLSTLWQRPAQIVQPWWFGDPAFKATCWWLDRLPPLKPTHKLKPPAANTKEFVRWSKVHQASPGPDRAKDRARTYPGMAAAIADQWFR